MPKNLALKMKKSVLSKFILHCFDFVVLLASRKRLTEWDTDITPLVGEELLVEVLDDVPLTMHNFVSVLAQQTKNQQS